MKRFDFLLPLSTLLLVGATSYGQHDWTVSLKNPQVFIENQGQYDALTEGFAAVPRYVIDHGFGWQVMATTDGLQYLVQRTVRDADAEEVETFGESGNFGEVEKSTIAMKFLGASASRQLLASDVQADYYTYSYPVGETYHSLDHVPAFAQLTYQDLYPGIDAQLEGPEDGGVKYSFHVDAGADPSAIRLEWSGATPSLDQDGNVHLPAVLGELVDQQPRAWYADDPQATIPVRFALQGQVVRFELGNYDTQRAIVIDPWTVNPALPAPFNRAFEVDGDAAGNIYVFGGGMGYNLKKYNAAGTLQWTHVSPWDTSNSWFGELLSLTTGDVFITSGSPAKIRRITAAGATTFTNNGPFLNMDEYWTLTQNCDRTKLISGGTRIVSLTSPQGFIFDLNLANGNQLAGSPYNVSPIGMKEIRALMVGGNGNYFLLSNDNLICLNQSFGIVYSIASGSSHPYYSPAYMAKNVQGQNIIDANTTYIFTMNGATLERRNISTGAIVNAVGIPGGGFTGGFFGNGATNGGLCIDNCGNVYVGSTNAVYKFDQNLASLGSVATTGAIYDVWVGPGGVVVWGGNGLLTSNTSFAPCVQKAISCVILGAELSYLQANCHLDRVELSWEIRQEKEMARYVVERTQDGLRWEERGTVASEGNHDAPFVYHFREASPLPSPDASWYYRLRMVSLDGTETLTGIAHVDQCADADPSIKLYPSVAQDRATLEFTSETAGMGKLSFVTPLGVTAREKSVQLIQGTNTLALPLAGLAPGLYHVRLTDAHGTMVVRNARLVKE